MTTDELNQALAAVAKAEEEVRKLRTERDKLDVRIAEAETKARDLKLGLAARLRAYLPELEGTSAAAQSEPAPEGRRTRGVTAAVLEILADGQARSTPELAAELRRRGLPTKSLGVALGTLVKKGRLARPSRGVYAQATPFQG